MHPAPCVGVSPGFEPVFGVTLAVPGVETLVAFVDSDRDEYGDNEEDSGENSYSDYDACAKLVRLDRASSGGETLRRSIER